MDDSPATRVIRVVSWNLQGSAGVDVEAVADVVGSIEPDVLVVQEIQRGQARRLARTLRMPAMCWAFKSLALNTWPEGLAVFTPHRFASTDSFLLRRAWLWNWRRRIGVLADIERREDRFGVINVHLSPHDAGKRRQHEARLVVERARRLDRPPVIAGDLNDLPGGLAHQVFTGSGWVDVWEIDRLKGSAGSTNWSPGDRHGRPPTQRLDFVLAPGGWMVEDARVLAEPDRLDWFAERSDHLPLFAAVSQPDGNSLR